MLLLETPNFLLPGKILSEELLINYFDVRSSGSCVYVTSFLVDVTSCTFAKASGADGSGIYLKMLGQG